MEKDLKELKTKIIEFCKKYKCLITDIDYITHGRNLEGVPEIVNIQLEVKK